MLITEREPCKRKKHCGYLSGGPAVEFDRCGKEKWRTLNWRMTEADAAAWLPAPDNAGKVIEKVPESAEHRGDAKGGGYVA